jgi:universal stress protein A
VVIKRILVPIDFSDSSLRALSAAQDFARAFGAEVLVLHVVEPIYYATPADMYVTSPNLSLMLDEQRHLAQQQLARIAAGLKGKGQRHRTILKTGTPAQLITDTAEETKADLIVMSTHGRSGLAHILLGSVTERVVRHASCPVLTIRQAATKPKPAAKKRRAKQH